MKRCNFFLKLYVLTTWSLFCIVFFICSVSTVWQLVAMCSYLFRASSSYIQFILSFHLFTREQHDVLFDVKRQMNKSLECFARTFSSELWCLIFLGCHLMRLNCRLATKMSATFIITCYLLTCIIVTIIQWVSSFYHFLIFRYLRNACSDWNVELMNAISNAMC